MLNLVSLETAGDHHLALCDVVAYDTFEGRGDPLYTDDLPDFKGVRRAPEKKGMKGVGKGGKGIKKKKDPNAPKRPLSSYMIFASETRGKVLEESPGMSLGDVGRALGERWKAISPDEKETFEAKAAAAKAKYEEEMKAYNAGKKE